MANEKSKTVKMGADKGNVENQKKLSYEQLEQVAGNLNQQCRQQQAVIQNLQNAIAEFNEINMLLDVLGKSEHFSEKFVTRCSSKIEELITKAMDASEEMDAESKKDK
jgi:1-aminocyclopropane-1-carboxylate deaminase/D-cysteine desulfhydrase-like pyridoxal-dependent ACC family enzyme